MTSCHAAAYRMLAHSHSTRVATWNQLHQNNDGTENGLHPKIVLFSSITTLPDHLNKSFLHQKYVVERLSLRQIAALAASSRPAVSDSLTRFGIPIRESGNSRENPTQLPFGKKRVNGKMVDFQAERRVIESVKKMRLNEGLSYNAIARILTEMKIPTKQQGRKWHHEMVRSILKREGIIPQDGKQV